MKTKDPTLTPEHWQGARDYLNGLDEPESDHPLCILGFNSAREMDADE